MVPGFSGVDSEVGRLRAVIMHRPGAELKRVLPRNAGQLLFAGLPWAARAQQEHDIFTQALNCLAMRGVAGFVTAPRGEWKPELFPMLASGRKLQGILGGDAAPQIFIPMLIDYYRQRGLLRVVEASRGEDEVTQAILDALA